MEVKLPQSLINGFLSGTVYAESSGIKPPALARMQERLHSLVMHGDGKRFYLTIKQNY